MNLCKFRQLISISLRFFSKIKLISIKPFYNFYKTLAIPNGPAASNISSATAPSVRPDQQKKVAAGGTTDRHPRFFPQSVEIWLPATAPARVRRPRNSTPNHWRKRPAGETATATPGSQPDKTPCAMSGRPAGGLCDRERAPEQ
jgi:hypothetical protein